MIVQALPRENAIMTQEKQKPQNDPQILVQEPGDTHVQHAVAACSTFLTDQAQTVCSRFVTEHLRSLCVVT